jgi:ribose 1,5-bisphosphokinase
MNDAAAQPSVTSGRFVLVVGPSGAGKDTLIAGARAVLEKAGVVFARRIVTREATVFEDNESVEPSAFEAALAAGQYALYWHAHGLSYALPIAIEAALRQGRHVVANVSRGVVGAARRRYPAVVVVMVTARPEVLAARLAGRARPSDGPVEERLKRADKVFEEPWQPDVVIDNSGDVADGVAALIRAITGA